MGPLPRMMYRAGKRVEPVNLRAIGRREATRCTNQKLSNKTVTGICTHAPRVRLVIVVGTVHTGFELDVFAQVEPVRNMICVLEQFGLWRKAFGPLPFLLQRFRELVGILHALYVDPGTGVAVPVPGTAYAVASFKRSNLESEFPKAVKH